MKTTFLRFSAMALVVLGLSPAARAAGAVTLAVQGGYSLTNNEDFKGGINGGLLVERRFGKSLGIGVFGGYQQYVPGGIYEDVTAYSIPVGAVINLYASESLYLGANVGTQTIKMSNEGFGLSGSENFVGGQAGLLLSPKVGIEGRYLYSMADGGVNVIQMMLQLRFSP